MPCQLRSHHARRWNPSPSVPHVLPCDGPVAGDAHGAQVLSGIGAAGGRAEQKGSRGLMQGGPSGPSQRLRRSWSREHSEALTGTQTGQEAPWGLGASWVAVPGATPPLCAHLPVCCCSHCLQHPAAVAWQPCSFCAGRISFVVVTVIIISHRGAVEPRPAPRALTDDSVMQPGDCD